MPTGYYPIAAYSQGVRVVAQMDGVDSSATDGCFAEDTNAIFCPLEVIRPDLRTWIEEFNGLARLGIHCFDLVTLVSVADGAGSQRLDSSSLPPRARGMM